MATDKQKHSNENVGIACRRPISLPYWQDVKGDLYLCECWCRTPRHCWSSNSQPRIINQASWVLVESGSVEILESCSVLIRPPFEALPDWESECVSLVHSCPGRDRNQPLIGHARQIAHLIKCDKIGPEDTRTPCVSDWAFARLLCEHLTRICLLNDLNSYSLVWGGTLRVAQLV